MNLPCQFKERMEALLGSRWEAFLESYEKDRFQGLRINPLKWGAGDLGLEQRYLLRAVPWTPGGFYYGADMRPGKHPLHEAGAYYIQEPSAMAVAELLDAGPGELILDLCAAPGGKSTQIAGHMGQRGLLICNEIHPSRARILSQNMERLGIANAVVTNETPARLGSAFPEFFDRILVDAPCSGEGMFRKDETAVTEWSVDHVKLCAARQREILEQAAGMLKPGGRLVYSTCTFSPEENEGSIQALLCAHPEFSVEHVKVCPQFADGQPEWIEGGWEELRYTFRLWPHLLDGEGHFLAVLRKAGTPDQKNFTMPRFCQDQKLLAEYVRFLEETIDLHGSDLAGRREICLFGEQLYLVPPSMPDFSGLRVLRPGLHMGTVKKNRFEPSHALALYLDRHKVRMSYELGRESQETLAYLKGEAIRPGRLDLFSADKGWVLMTTEGISVGWAKLAGGILKNHYPKGLRWV